MENMNKEKIKEKIPCKCSAFESAIFSTRKRICICSKSTYKNEKWKSGGIDSRKCWKWNRTPIYTGNIEKNTLVASIHMADIFKNKANVQTAIYVFDVGKPHNTKQVVKFLDFSYDGYTRQNRKKATISTNLRDTDHARERYEEAVNIVLYGKKYMQYFTDDTYIEDTITLAGNDWTFAQHKKIDTVPKEDDFTSLTSDYLAWKASLKSNGKKAKENSELEKLRNGYIKKVAFFAKFRQRIYLK